MIGYVLSKKLEKTAVVVIERVKPHPLYKKQIRTRKKYLVHDSLGVKEGDKVKIAQTRPISKRKHYKIVEVVK